MKSKQCCYLAGIACFIFFFSFITLPSNLQAQTKHAVYFEGLGSGLVYSLNYEYRFGQDLKSGVKIGGGYSPFDNSTFVHIPVSYNYLIGRERHFLEVGAGVTYINGDASFLGDYSYENDFIPHGILLYRFSPPDGGFLARIGLTPLFSEDFNVGLWLGASVGWSF